MPDREEVIKAIEACMNHPANCDECYLGGPGFGIVCREMLMQDALILLREQEPDEPRCNSGINGVTSKPAQLQRCVCGTLIVRRGDAHSCPYCGRAVKWDD